MHAIEDIDELVKYETVASLEKVREVSKCDCNCSYHRFVRRVI